MIRGCQHGLPHLDPQVDISAIQSVGIQDLYHQVYKLRRLLGSLPCRPEQGCELTRDVVSSLKNCLRWRGGKQPRGHEEWEPEPTDTPPSQDRVPQKMRQDTSAEREIVEAREAHCQVLAATAALERIERLSQSTTRSRADSQVPSQSHNQQRRRSQGQSKRCCRALPEDSPTPSPTHSPPQWGPEALEDQEAELPYLEFNLGPPPELGPDVEHFFQEQASGQGDDREGDTAQEPPVEDYERWVEWRGQRIATPAWWCKLLEVLGVSNIQELAQKIRASFELPQQMSEIHDVKNYYPVPPAPRCIQWKAFLLPPDPMFPCQDIREGQSQKTVAYMQALQYWVAKANVPMPG